MTYEPPAPPQPHGGAPGAEPPHPFSAPAGPAAAPASQPGTPPGFGQQPANTLPPGFGQPPGTPPGFGQQPANTFAPGFGQPPGTPPGYGQQPANTFAPGFGQPPAPPAPRRRVGLIVAIVVGIVVVVVGGCIGGGIFAVRRAASSISLPSPPPPVTKGGCVKQTGVDKYEGVSCKDPKRIGEVLAVIDGMSTDVQNCDPASDQMLDAGYLDGGFKIICVKNAGAAHVSAPGLGGGVLVAGDCMRMDMEVIAPDIKEVPCTERAYEAKVVARVGTEAQCPVPAVLSHELYHKRDPVLCLATGPAIAGVGQCIRVVNSDVHYAVLPCNSPQATHKILARAATDSACPRRTTQYSMDYHALPRSKYVCFQKV